MSNLKLVHSGGNSVSLTTPTNNPSSNVTFKLPQADGSSGQALVTDGNGAFSFATPSPYQFSSWYVTTDYTPTAADVILRNWAESNADGYERLGTAPTYSTGAFTMPSTGYWRVQASITYYHTSATGDTFAFALRHSTDSGSSYNHFATVGGRLDGSLPANAKLNWTLAGTFKVANASTSRLCLYGVDIRTDGRIMGGTQSGTAGYCSSMHIEKMANL